jgi:hypothetical protein
VTSFKDWEEHADREVTIQGCIASIGEVEKEGRLQGGSGCYFGQHLWGDLEDRWLQALHLQMRLNLQGFVIFSTEHISRYSSDRPPKIAPASITFMAISIRVSSAKQ